MNEEHIEGATLELKPPIPKGWEHLTEDHWAVLNGPFDELVGNLRVRDRLAAEKELLHGVSDPVGAECLDDGKVER